MWFVSNQLQIHTNSKMQMRVPKLNTYCITPWNAHLVSSAHSKFHLSTFFLYRSNHSIKTTLKHNTDTTIQALIIYTHTHTHIYIYICIHLTFFYNVE